MVERDEHLDLLAKVAETLEDEELLEELKKNADVDKIMRAFS